MRCAAPRLVLDAHEALQWALCEPILREVVLSGLRIWPAISMFVGGGAIYRAGDAANPDRSGIHAVGPRYRALDGSGRNLAKSTASQWRVCGVIAERVNRLWIYDPRRPGLTVAVGAKHGTAPHVHFQSHPNTVKSRRP